MAPRAVRGVLAYENAQSGDGRVIAQGALTWPDPPLPLAWIKGGDQHVGVVEEAPQIGNILTITRNGDVIEFTGVIDDENVDGAEVIRRLEQEMAPLGSRFSLSIDPDDWQVEVVATGTVDQAEPVIVASGCMTTGTLALTPLRALLSAAGDPDPEGEILFSDAADAVIERFVKLRIRGVTCCSIGALDGAYLELADAAPEASDGGTPAQVAALPVAASAPVRPPLAWFEMPEPELGSDLLVEQPNGSMACPLTITDEGQVFGHAAGPGCHTGYLDRCVLAPESPTGYARYNLGYIECDDGTKVNTGPLVVGSDHADLSLFAPGARDHYANACLAWADVRAYQGALGPWVCGALRPDVTPEQVRVLRASMLSGDWRDEGMGLDMIAVLTVNGPGFPILREALAASGLPPVASATGPRVRYVDGKRTALVAAGVVSRCPECAERARMQEAARLNGGDFAAMLDMLERIDRRTKALIPQAMAASAARIRGE